VSGFLWRGTTTDLTVTYDSEAAGEEISVHCGEQERMVLDLEQWAELCKAAEVIGPHAELA
jgi:hypothetical protein